MDQQARDTQPQELQQARPKFRNRPHRLGEPLLHPTHQMDTQLPQRHPRPMENDTMPETITLGSWSWQSTVALKR
eukprot:scaffold14272_cov99-Isochrysis_galbana.AAC.5